MISLHPGRIVTQNSFKIVKTNILYCFLKHPAKISFQFVNFPYAFRLFVPLFMKNLFISPSKKKNQLICALHVLKPVSSSITNPLHHESRKDRGTKQCFWLHNPAKELDIWQHCTPHSVLPERRDSNLSRCNVMICSKHTKKKQKIPRQSKSSLP